MGFLLLGGSVSAAHAGTPYLDPYFGKQGEVMTNLGPESSWPAHSKLSPGGEIVVAAGKVVARYLPSGQLDPSFGSDGIVRVGSPEGLDFSISDLAVDSAGKVVLFGTAVDRQHYSSVSFAYPPEPFFVSFGMVLRYTQGGRLDPSFGDGDGIVRTTFGLPADPTYKLVAATAGSGTIDSMGRIAMVGGVTDVTTCIGHSTFGRRDLLVARLTPEGSFDPAFGGGDGISGIGRVVKTASSLGSTGNGEMLLLGQPELCGAKISFLRINANGMPDPAPKTSATPLGKQYVTGIGQDHNGRFLLLTSPAGSGPRFAHLGSLLRLTARGKPDQSFGRKGRVAIRIPGRRSSLTSTGVDSQGRILVAGTLYPPRLSGRPAPQPSSLLLRLSASGKREWKLGHGRLITNFGYRLSVSSLVIDEADRAVLIGTYYRDLSDNGLALARYVLGP